jgi:hypothetical protein
MNAFSHLLHLVVQHSIAMMQLLIQLTIRRVELLVMILTTDMTRLCRSRPAGGHHYDTRHGDLMNSRHRVFPS